ncbi:MAG: hypothetical protein EAY75_02515, partial [Bacteroidetes bacterium]
PLFTPQALWRVVQLQAPTALLTTKNNFLQLTAVKKYPKRAYPVGPAPRRRVYHNHNGNPPTNANYPANATPASTAESVNLYKLNANSNKTGLRFMLKVMPASTAVEGWL